MSSYFSVSIMPPSKARLAKGPTVQGKKHPWKDQNKRSKRKSKVMTKIIHNDAKRASL